MTPEKFVYWLQGFVEISGSKQLSPEQLVIVQDHLNLVFQKVTPVRPAPGVQQVQELQETIERLRRQVPEKKCSKSLRERLTKGLRVRRLSPAQSSGDSSTRVYC